MAIGIPEYRLPARGPPGGDRRGSSASASSSGSTPRWAATSRWATSSARASGRSSWRPAPRRAGGSACPATACRASSRRRSSSSRSTSASTPGCRARSWSSAAAARRWTPRGPPSAAAPRRSRSPTAAAARTCRPRTRRSRPPSARGSRSGPASRSPRSSAATGRSVGPPLRRAAPDRRGRGRPRRLGARRRTRSWSCPAATILVAVGEEPDPSILPEGAGIEVSGWAGIVADPRTLATGRAGIFAGGDVVSGPKTIIDAVASGRRAAASVHEFLAGVRDGEARDHADRPLRDAARALALAGHRTAAAGARRRCRSSTPGSFRGHPAGLRRGRPPAARPSRCFRCDAVRSRRPS